ncbi:MAG: hypothetical protein AAFX93_13560 [Verrucomicrobiota bacterium]
MSLDQISNFDTDPLLGGLIVSVGISNPLEPSKWSYGADQVNEVVLEIARTLISHGAAVCFGHDWRADGVMLALYEMAEAHDAVLAHEDARKNPLIHNFRYHGSANPLEEWRERQIRGVLNLVDTSAPNLPDGALGTYQRAVSLSVMRREMTEESTARIAFGGRDMIEGNLQSAPWGRTPGVLEEILLSLALKKPLYLSRLFGGVTEYAIDRLEGIPRQINFQLNGDLAKCYQDPVTHVEELRDPASDLRPLDLESIWDNFHRAAGRLGSESNAVIKRLCESNRLSLEENQRLFNASTSAEALNWILIGLRRLKAGR